MKNKIYSLLTISVLSFFTANAQLPNPVLVGYYETWNNFKLSQVNFNYNVIDVAFAKPSFGTTSNMVFSSPSGYSGTIAQQKIDFIADIDALHAQGKIVLLSIGGANDPIFLANSTDKTTFISSILQIFSSYSYKFDGLDLDLETTSLNFGAWTMSAPAVGQTNMVTAIQSIMSSFQTQTGKKMILTMAPECVYVQGGLSNWQTNNVNGGAYLPIINGLRNELDLLHCQLYNAGGVNGGMFASNGQVYYDTSPNFITAMTETVIKGFTLVAGKGTFTGVPANKIAIGLPANSCTAAGTGYVIPADVCLAAKYLKGDISKPAGWTYTRTATYPDLRGLMTWSINEDNKTCNGAWSFANNFSCAFTVSTGTESLDEVVKNKIYPNPSTNNFTLQTAAFSNIKVYDVSGKMIEEISSSGNISFGDHWNSGIYFVKIISNEGEANFKIIKY